MRTRDRAWSLARACALGAALVGALAPAACIHNPQPEERTPEVAAADGHGGTAVITLKNAAVVAGELIAVGPDAFYVLRGSELLTVPDAQVDEAKVYGWQSETGYPATWGTLGTVSSISHGYILAISMPVWILTTVALTAVETRVPRFTYPGDSLDELAKWARFPQGLPPGMTGRLLFVDDRPRPGDLPTDARPASAPAPELDAGAPAPALDAGAPVIAPPGLTAPIDGGGPPGLTAPLDAGGATPPR